MSRNRLKQMFHIVGYGDDAFFVASSKRWCMGW